MFLSACTAREPQLEAVGLFPVWFLRVDAFICPQFLLSDHTRLCSAVISHFCTDLDALGRSGYNICSALHTVEWKLIAFYSVCASKLHVFSTTTVISQILLCLCITTSLPSSLRTLLMSPSQSCEFTTVLV